jgi:hypothetical protein
MFVVVMVALLVVAGLFQAIPPHKDRAWTNPELVSLQSTWVVVREENPKKKIDWAITIPYFACENGTPVLNQPVEPVFLASSAKAFCPGLQPPDVLPGIAPTTTSAAQDESYEVGTVIALGVSRAKVVVAADSLNVLLKEKRLPDGILVERKIEYDDCACKLTQLTPTLLFAADGEVSSSTNTVPAAVLYDAHKLALLAAQNYHSDPKEEKLRGGMIRAIAIRWAWDVDFRMRHGFEKGWRPIETLEGIFVGLEPSGEIAMAVAKLEYPKQRPGMPVSPVVFTVGSPSPPPTDFTWVEAFGIKDVAESFYSPRAQTELTKAENKLISREIMKDPKQFSQRVPERLVELTIQHYQAVAGTEDPLFVHGPIDLAVLERKKKINWIHSKKCSGARSAHSDVPELAIPKK